MWVGKSVWTWVFITLSITWQSQLLNYIRCWQCTGCFDTTKRRFKIVYIRNYMSLHLSNPVKNSQQLHCYSKQYTAVSTSIKHFLCNVAPDLAIYRTIQQQQSIHPGTFVSPRDNVSSSELCSRSSSKYNTTITAMHVKKSWNQMISTSQWWWYFFALNAKYQLTVLTF